MSIWDGFENVEVSKSGNYITPGRYRLHVDQVVQFASKKDGTPFFCVEATVLHTTSPDYREGDSVSWLQSCSKPGWRENIKNFCMALNPGCNAKDITREVVESLVGGDNPAQGLTVDVDAKKTPTKSINPSTGKPNMYTRLWWTPSDKDWTHAPVTVSEVEDDEKIPF